MRFPYGVYDWLSALPLHVGSGHISQKNSQTPGSNYLNPVVLYKKNRPRLDGWPVSSGTNLRAGWMSGGLKSPSVSQLMAAVSQVMPRSTS